ncbi:hypothetical protein CONPUDRAFT_164720 [Coniophora puteana RWD-64-598 SS2]|uniref:Uncharacterized protein n=1 Tax=Coniophora puteana (strain RWD-64-598) TaxID=741705 RepID=A0A5M3MSC7_CONPW|nr:uncharacterized protein CONPUDRAFT_164720 [Coniophora puteana RWD-64-598 SS2]EIW82073.1 hypothetical protein CONPUDRAFT_164720 [Coniophora puteana RWD-64-598 SS2]
MNPSTDSAIPTSQPSADLGGMAVFHQYPASDNSSHATSLIHGALGLPQASHEAGEPIQRAASAGPQLAHSHQLSPRSTSPARSADSEFQTPKAGHVTFDVSTPADFENGSDEDEMDTSGGDLDKHPIDVPPVGFSTDDGYTQPIALATTDFEDAFLTINASMSTITHFLITAAEDVTYMSAHQPEESARVLDPFHNLLRAITIHWNRIYSVPHGKRVNNTRAQSAPLEHGQFYVPNYIAPGKFPVPNRHPDTTLPPISNLSQPLPRVPPYAPPPPESSFHPTTSGLFKTPSVSRASDIESMYQNPPARSNAPAPSSNRPVRPPGLPGSVASPFSSRPFPGNNKGKVPSITPSSVSNLLRTEPFIPKAAPSFSQVAAAPPPPPSASTSYSMGASTISAALKLRDEDASAFRKVFNVKSQEQRNADRNRNKRQKCRIWADKKITIVFPPGTKINSANIPDPGPLIDGLKDFLFEKTGERPTYEIFGNYAPPMKFYFRFPLPVTGDMCRYVEEYVSGLQIASMEEARVSVNHIRNTIVFKNFPNTYKSQDEILTLLRNSDSFANVPIVGYPRFLQGTLDEERGLLFVDFTDDVDNSILRRLTSHPLRIGDFFYRCEQARAPAKRPMPRCGKCLYWGHFSDKCTSNIERCGWCGNNHREKDHGKFTLAHLDDERANVRCFNCGGPHRSDSSSCPFYLHRFEHEWIKSHVPVVYTEMIQRRNTRNPS